MNEKIKTMDKDDLLEEFFDYYKADNDPHKTHEIDINGYDGEYSIVMNPMLEREHRYTLILLHGIGQTPI